MVIKLKKILHFNFIIMFYIGRHFDETRSFFPFLCMFVKNQIKSVENINHKRIIHSDETFISHIYVNLLQIFALVMFFYWIFLTVFRALEMSWPFNFYRKRKKRITAESFGFVAKILNHGIFLNSVTWEIVETMWLKITIYIYTRGQSKGHLTWTFLDFECTMQQQESSMGNIIFLHLIEYL